MGDDVLTGADAPPEHYEKPQGFSVTLGIEEPAEAERVFHALEENGVNADAAAGDILGHAFWYAH